MLLGQRLAHRPHHLRLDPLFRLAAEIAGFNREAAALALDDWRTAEQPCDTGGIQRCRHGHQPQVVTQRPLHIERQCKAEVAFERAFMELVKQHTGNAGKLRVIQDHPGEYALGDDLDAGAGADTAFHAHPVADSAAHLLAKACSHAPGGSTGSKAPRFQKENTAIIAPGCLQQRQRHTGRLACTGLCHQHSIAARLKRCQQFRQRRINRQRR